MFQVKNAEAQIRALKDKLAILGLPNVRLLDSQTVAISTTAVPVIGEENLTVKIDVIEDEAQRTDALGNAQRVYNPMVARVLVEDDRTAAESALLRVVAELQKAAVGVEVYTAPALDVADRAADTATDALLTKIRDVRFPLTGEQ